MIVTSFLIKNINNIFNSISMSISNISNIRFIVSIDKMKFTDMESGNNRVRFHNRMIIK